MKKWIAEIISLIAVVLCIFFMDARITKLENALRENTEKLINSDFRILELINKEVESRGFIDNEILSKLPIMHIGDAKLDSVHINNRDFIGYIINKDFYYYGGQEDFKK